MKAIESLQSFSVSADPFLRHFQLDITHELQLLTSLDFTGGMSMREQASERERERKQVKLMKDMRWWAGDINIIPIRFSLIHGDLQIS